MKRKLHHSFHKWLGIPVCLLMLLFCLSGIVLNHRQFFSQTGISRSLLPQRYHYVKWNNGLLRGTLPLPDGSVLIYGSSGIFLYSNTFQKNISDASFLIFNSSFNQDVRRMVTLPNGHLVAITPFAAHFLQYNQFAQNTGRDEPCPYTADDNSSLFSLQSSLNMGERLSDAVTHGDTLIVVGRSHLFLSTGPNYTTFKKITLPSPYGNAPSQTLFRTIWQLHSGELFGLPGRLIVDFTALILLFLSLTGLLILILRRRSLSTFNFQLLTFKWHNTLGRYTIILTLFVVVTGAFLRPPLMIPLVLTKQPINSWHDKLRMLRYDETTHQWLLHTSVGFYAMNENPTIGHSQLFPLNFPLPQKVGPMGLSVWEKGPDGQWIFGEAPYVSGYSADFGEPFFVYYGEGTDRLPQPLGLEGLPISLWNLCLELHTGRILFGSTADYFYVFLSGLLTIWVLLTGWKIRRNGVKKSTA